jgi:hypothetical protein
VQPVSLCQLSTEGPFGFGDMPTATVLRSMEVRMFEEAKDGQTRKANDCPTLRSERTY